MSSNIALFLVGLVFSAVAVFGRRAGGQKTLWLTCILATLILTVLSYYDWRRVASLEAPLGTYLAPATLPTIAVTLAIRWLAKTPGHPLLQVLLASAIWYVVAVASIAVTYFLL